MAEDRASQVKFLLDLNPAVQRGLVKARRPLRNALSFHGNLGCGVRVARLMRDREKGPGEDHGRETRNRDKSTPTAIHHPCALGLDQGGRLLNPHGGRRMRRWTRLDGAVIPAPSPRRIQFRGRSEGSGDLQAISREDHVDAGKMPGQNREEFFGCP